MFGAKLQRKRGFVGSLKVKGHGSSFNVRCVVCPLLVAQGES